MKKLLIILVAALLIGGVAYAAGVPQPAAVGSERMKVVGTLPSDPQSTVLLVRYGSRYPNDGGITSGDVVVWDINSADGITVSKCVADKAVSYVGVAVTDILTATNSFVDAGDRNWGYIAIKGYCLARVDTSSATTGHPLITNGGTLERSFGTNEEMSRDIGILLRDDGSDGLMPVYLR